MKNRVHGQTDDAIISLQSALKNFPNYKDAPIAQQMLVECYVRHDPLNPTAIIGLEQYGVGMTEIAAQRPMNSTTMFIWPLSMRRRSCSSLGGKASEVRAAKRMVSP